MQYPDMSAPRTPTIIRIGSGTAYQLTATSAAIAPGTNTPALTLPEPGKWLLEAEVTLRNNGATFAANRTITLKLRRTNNTAADITNGSRTFDSGVTTTVTGTSATANWSAEYDTLNSDDAVTIFADVSVIPSAGSLDVAYVKLKATKIPVKV